ncbi:transglycosylase SLT domain-containing protein [Xenorhabdus ehlersii]|uniref:Lytic transglycosylase n=1 Tax=Xenorhabdus ehlersii TaxID=290111 RepID=A0A2D0IRX4_9GAMM|nr:transglycosylase SLT domain-containing protein [Xenorhabdus ehlersii]PHM24599.1 lytic transglycosylase [Xenorhabdus ehlersii]RKE91238.1 transglycosylase-like protein with SLT domain [Xenorhabdus ehlersii]
MNWCQIIGMVLLWCGGLINPVLADEPPYRSLQYRNDLIRASRVIWGLNAPVADFAAQLHQESGWKPRAISPVGAQGMAQFMPATADWISQRIPELSNKDPFNPAWSIRAMVHYDYWLWQRIKAADECQRMAMVLSSYNGGLGWLLRDKKKTEAVGLNPWVWFGHVEFQNAGRNATAWKENRHYPRRILLELAPRYLVWGGARCAN